MKKPPFPAKNDSSEYISNNFNSGKAQYARLLNYLREHKSCSSIEATRELDIIDPRRRIKDLWERGHRIDMVWSHEPTPCGRVHRVGRYYLIKEGLTS